MDRLKYIRSIDDDIGVWEVISRDSIWLRCQPVDERAIELSKITPDGIVDFRRRDVRRDTTQQKETLL